MKINVKDLGPIKNANIDICDFNVITGQNNTGKTYISYALYGFLQTWSQNIKDLNTDKASDVLIENGFVEINLLEYKKKVLSNFGNLTDDFSRNLNKIFSANEEEFEKTIFSLEVDQKEILLLNKFEVEVNSKGKGILKAEKNKDSKTLSVSLLGESKEKLPPKFIIMDILSEIIYKSTLSEVLPEPYIITSERTGISIFQNELDINKNVLFEKLIQADKGKFNLNPFDYLRDVFDRYSVPIKDGIDRIRDIEKEFKKKSFIAKEYPNIVNKLEKSTGIGYKNIKGQFFITYKEGRKKIALPLYLGSSSSRALFDLYIFIKHSAQKGQILIIDEPELNLHPSVQIQVARLLAAISNTGIKVIMTTHSDYIVKEINNLLMINNLASKEKFLKKYKYEDLESIKNINFYISENNTLNKVKVDKYGLERTTFDDSINQLIETSEYLYNQIE